MFVLSERAWHTSFCINNVEMHYITVYLVKIGKNFMRSNHKFHDVYSTKQPSN